eukprot:TRINITY_DN23448_c0_g1_i1.p1 TRINITY_DN23448_c0_g1~~TRINITY_DN23448_c0_g1_i1.p1  ORF type:complete len:417 (-),score=62.83 TRINITY_DN23448_c0_g1_i1:622-1872(-)
MKHLRLALVVFATAASLARAQDEQQQRPPTEIPDFSNLDDYIYEPKSILSYGFRYLNGAKLKFFGSGRLATTEDPGAPTGTNVARSYHDGSVGVDARFAPRVDGNGNPVKDPDSGSQIFDPIAPDGRTNTWAFQNASQVTEDGFVSFNTYTADINDAGTRKKDANSNFGMELAVSRDMGKLFGSRFTWQLIAGLSINDLSGSTTDTVQAKLTALTDLYSLNGQVAPVAPYSAPSSASENVLDSAGNAVLNDDGSAQTVTTDTTVLLTNQPAARTSTVTTNSTSVKSRWKLSGAYYTFRAGPTVFLPITSRFRASFSAGAALIYAGSNYSVTQTFTPDTGAEITDTSSSQTAHVLPGYYADASLQFDLTERTGVYAGAIMQGAGSYTQDVNSEAAHYTTKIDLGRQQGFRGGLTIRF